MRNKAYILFLVMLMFSLVGQAQLTTDADVKRKIYKKEMYGGISMHSRGFGIHGRFLKYVDGFNKAGFEVELTKIRHPKETLTPDNLLGNSRGFVFGRINSMFALRGGYTQEKILFDKTEKGSISVAWNYTGGLSIGLLKPIYVQVTQQTQDNTTILVTDRYNPVTMPASTVIGEAGFLRGFDEMRFRPGIYLKSGFSFDYQLIDEKITTLEVGAIYDFYFGKVKIFSPDILDEDVNKIGFLQLYFAFNFGVKKN